MAEMMKEIEKGDAERFREMEEHPRCALLPSTEKLEVPKVFKGSRGSDETNVLDDVNLVKDWVTKSGLVISGSSDLSGTDGENLHHGVYNSLIRHAFSSAFVPLRNTASPELEELLVWYYVGHGLDKEKAQESSDSSSPILTGCVVSDRNTAANELIVTEGRKVKGGELCLHRFGYCDLYGLVKPFIDAVKAPSRNAEGRKKNKHLVIILDSCFSGTIAQELKHFEDEMNKNDPSFLLENSVSIQAACGPDQHAFGGYFSPCFVYLNDPDNEELLNGLKDEWMNMTEEKKEKFKSREFQSPVVATTRRPSQDSHDVTMELTIQKFNCTLFKSPGFFTFCSSKVYQHQDKSLFDGKDRVLNRDSAKKFMDDGKFEVLDYKLKTYTGDRPSDPNANTPMGLFLLKDHRNAHVGLTVCAHIHFDKLIVAQRINLVHHRKRPGRIVLYLEDLGELDESAISNNEHKVKVLDTHSKDAKYRSCDNAKALVGACRAFVESKEPSRWKYVSHWNMTKSWKEVFRGLGECGCCNE